MNLLTEETFLRIASVLVVMCMVALTAVLLKLVWVELFV